MGGIIDSRITSQLKTTAHYYKSEWSLRRIAGATDNLSLSIKYNYMVNVSLNPADNFNVTKTITKTIPVN